MSAAEWADVSIAELQAARKWALNGGPFGSKLVSRDYVEAGVPVIRGANLPNDKRFSFEDFVFVSEEKADELLANNAHPGDVVFTQRGTLGQVGIIPEDAPFTRFVISQSQMKLTVDKARVDAMWLFYCFRDPSMQQEMINRASSSGVPHINLGVLREFKLRLPSLAEQRRIASILSAYDDLIENNTRRIAILEEMARRIYEEWFVRFRFPGHEGVRMVESELGLVPEGWEAKALGMLVAHSIGGGWGQETESEEFAVPAYVIRGTDIPDVRQGSLGRSPCRFHKASNFRSRKLKGGDIVFEVSGGSKDQPVGRAVMVGDALLERADAPVICASFCRLVRADKTQVLPELLQLHFERICESREIMQYQTQSTGITNFKFTVFLEKEIVLQPPASVQAQFAVTVRPMLQLAENFGIKNAVLRTTRDLLLPKLISGELDVSALPEPEAIAI